VRGEPFLHRSGYWAGHDEPATAGRQAAAMGFRTCTEGQSDGLGEYRTFKKSLGGEERGLLEIEPSPALERGHYEKEMDHRRNRGI
jgi:hypothetical protein